MFRKKKYKSFIIQKYIQNLLLYKKRKFDIRCFGLINFHNYNLRSFWYEEGYVRTSSFEFNEDNIENVFIHLTNDAIQ